jgi:hypothetical protein
MTFILSLQKHALSFSFALLFVCLLSWSSFSSAQSIWLESGLAYSERLSDTQANQNYEPFLSFGLKGLVPVSDTLSLYLHPFWQGGFALDAGLWVDFPGNIQDLEGFNSYAGIGLGFLPVLTTNTSTGITQRLSGFSFSLSVGISYDLSQNAAVTLGYTHHPILSPTLSQAFDISLGLRLFFDR